MCIRDRIQTDVMLANESNFKEVERNIEKMKEWGTDMGKLNAHENNKITDDNGVNTDESVVVVENGTVTGECNENKNNEEIINEVSVSYKNELTSSGGKIVENGVFKDCLLYTSRCV